MLKTSLADFREFLQRMGLERGDRVLVHSDYSSLGLVEGGPDAVMGALLERLDAHGTLVFPTFTFSFCRGEVFDVQKSRATTGVLPNAALAHTGAVRSVQPIHSFCAIGADAVASIAFTRKASFGPGTAFESMLNLGFKVLLLGVDNNTFVHHAEALVRVPYRFDKHFDGTISHNGRTYADRFSMYVRREDAAGTAHEDRRPARELFFKSPDCRTENFRLGTHRLFRADAFVEFTARHLRRDPLFLVDKDKFRSVSGIK